MRRYLGWAWNDLKRGFADLDPNKLMLVPLIYFAALAVADFVADDFCRRWPGSLHCPGPMAHKAETDNPFLRSADL